MPNNFHSESVYRKRSLYRFGIFISFKEWRTELPLMPQNLMIGVDKRQPAIAAWSIYDLSKFYCEIFKYYYF